MEQDELLAKEFQKEFSPKNKPKDSNNPQLMKQESEDAYNYNYDYDQHEEEDDDNYHYGGNNDQHNQDLEDVQKIN